MKMPRISTYFFFDQIDFRHLLHFLCAAAGDSVPILENLHNCQEAHSATRPEVIQCDPNRDWRKLINNKAISAGAKCPTKSKW